MGKGSSPWFVLGAAVALAASPLMQQVAVADEKATAATAEIANASLSVSGPCGTSSGTRFNFEPREDPLPQNGTAIDFLPGGGLAGSDLVVGAANDMRLLTSGSSTAPDFRGVFGLTSQTGFYVHRSDGANPCAPDFEGGLGALINPFTGNRVVGVGYPAIAAYPAGSAVFVADTRMGEGEIAESGFGVFRSTAAVLNNLSTCPGGTLSEAQSAQCWPSHVLVGLTNSFNFINASPHLAVDERAAGVGDVYITGTRTGNNQAAIVLVACKNDLSACSSATSISGSDLADLSHVAVRPDGGVTVTYTVYSGGSLGMGARADIKYVACTPHGAPVAPTCAAPILVQTETQAIPFNPFDPRTGLGAAQFVMHTFPKHVHRQDANGTETYVVWDRCKVSTVVPLPGITTVRVCPDADVVMAASTDNGQTWHFADVDTAAQDQFQPWAAVDRSTNAVNIAYYSSESDYLQHRSQVFLRQILPGNSTPDAVGAPTTITTTPMEPSGDPVMDGVFIGHYIGLASRSNRAYAHFTHTTVFGSYNGATSPEQNNHVSRIDF